MAINLQKGQKISLTKENKKLTNLCIGLGWDENTNSSGKSFLGRMFAQKEESIDCDASAILCKNGKLQAAKDVVCYSNLVHESKAVKHLGDNLTGAGDGDDEQIKVNLELLPKDFDKICFVVNIYQCATRNQHFGMIKDAFIRIVDEASGSEICKYNLTDDYNNKTAIIFGEVYKSEDEWKFNAIGEGTNDKDLKEITKRF